MPLEPQAIVCEARTWLDTPFRHQGRTHEGVDCAGLVIVTGAGLGLPYRDITSYGRSPRPRQMRAELDAQLERVPMRDAGPGIIVWMAFGRCPQHLGILTEAGMIHAYESIGRVVEQPVDVTWRALWRGLYRYRGLD